MRPIGPLTLYGNLGVFKNRLQAKGADLIARWQGLQQRLNHNVHIHMQRRFYDHCRIGLRRHRLQHADRYRDHRSSRVAAPVTAYGAILTLPNVYQDKVQGKAEEYYRMMANAGVTMLEIDFFQRSEDRGLESSWVVPR